MRILGIDPGLRITGFGVVDKDGARLTYVTSGRIRTAGGELAPRLKTILDGLAEVIREQRPAQIALEKVFVN
ncbi:MAG TPA: crossover junction endodeoxyribonuclease RuvC, partial [Burkholderiales bacterium]|nr:crossover junction endodeoxyribonuclease RuvC [Burkholderiales bacterium]